MPKHNHAHHVHKRAALLVRDAAPEKEKEEDKPLVISIVYVTASKTFDGPVGGYKTLNPPSFANSPNADDDSEKERPDNAESRATSLQDSDSRPTSKPPSKAKQNSKDDLDTDSEPASPTSSKSVSKVPSRTSSPASKTASTEAHSRPVAHSAQQTSSSTSTSIGEAAASAAASHTASVGSASQSQGMSGGAKAGLAVGVILIIGVLGLILLCLRRMKNKKKSYQKTDDEKAALGPHHDPARAQSIRSTRTTATAPRLSLRPVTQFLPDLAAKRKSGNLLATIGGPSQNAQDQNSEKPASPTQSSHPANPFGPHAEISQGAALPVPVKNQPTNPFENHAEHHDEPSRGALSPPVQAPAPLRIRTPTPEAASAASVAALSNIGAAREDRYKAPNHLNVSPSRPISPAGTEFSISSVSTGYLAHAPPPSNVYRVQLDFNPSMDDELALQAGQLIRLLHEYDDGWALCIRLDRSQQGVAPRTCLSARPVKPRPAGNNRGPPPRGSPPSGMLGSGQQRPMSPAGGRGPLSPYNREPSPMFPANRLGPRSMSPGPYGGGPQLPNAPPSGGKRRSNSASQIRDQRNSPPGPSPMSSIASNMQRMPMPMQLQAGIAVRENTYSSRKPVPGQAI